MKKINFMMILLWLPFLTSYAMNVKQHKHTLANLSVKITSQEMSITLDSPGHNLVGYEKKAKTRYQKQRVQNAYYMWEKEWRKLFALPPELQCKQVSQNVERISLDKEHDKYILKMKLKCTQNLHGQKMRINLIGFFPQIKHLNTVIESVNAQPLRVTIRSVDFVANL